MTTPEQKEIFTRLHKLFSDTNNQLASKSVELNGLRADYSRLISNFEEQNRVLHRYEEAFGPLPIALSPPAAPWGQPVAAQAPAIPVPGFAHASPSMPAPPTSSLNSKLHKELGLVFSYEVAGYVYQLLTSRT